jgi:ParB family chromosome partitioning protein
MKGKMTALANGPKAELHYDAACREIEQAKTMDEAKVFSSKAEAIAVYVRLMGDRKLEIDALDVRGRAEKKWAELHETMKAKGTRSQLVGPGVIGGSGNEPPIDTPTLEELGVDKKKSAYAHKLAALSKEEFEQKIAKWREFEEKSDGLVGKDILNAGKKPRGTFGAGEDEWYTPAEHIELARSVLNGIDLDPASSAAAQETVRATKFFTRKDDGLKREWHGNVWLNPPYSQPLMAQFISKLIGEYRAGRMTAAILLTNNYTDTVWFHEAASACTAICFTRGRLNFIDSTGSRRMQPIQGQTFLYFGKDLEAFAEQFRTVGFIVIPYGGKDVRT